MGFSEQESKGVLAATGNNLDQAAAILTASHRAPGVGVAAVLPVGSPPFRLFDRMVFELKEADGRWEMVEVVSMSQDQSEIRVSYMQTMLRVTLIMPRDAPRMRQLDAAAEFKTRQADDVTFASEIKLSGFNIVDCDRDGNCLFRAFAHQIYNDAERHAEVRKICYDYMAANRDFFSKWIDSDFDAYLRTQRELTRWGDHVEIVALAEYFNKRVEVLARSTVILPRPLSYNIPIVRISYHGSNHYNSVVDPAQPPPLGDGKKSLINLREKRIAEESKSVVRPGAAPVVVASMRAVPRTAVDLQAQDWETLWAKHKDLEAGISTEKIQFFITDLITTIHDRTLLPSLSSIEKTKRGKQCGALLDQVPEFTKPLMDSAVGRTPLAVTREELFTHSKPLALQISWDLGSSVT